MGPWIHDETSAKGNGIYKGEVNTWIIIASHTGIGDDGDPYAAQLCNDLQITEGGTIFGDWYLPSIYELDLIYLNKVIIDSTAIANGGNPLVSSSTEYYWSSTDKTGNFAWVKNLNFGFEVNGSKWNENNVRAIRSF